jgi:hypothetical protein
MVLVNIVASYASSTAHESSSTTDLHMIKREEARKMLREYLRKWRTKRAYEDQRHGNEELDRVRVKLVCFSLNSKV